MYGGGGFLMAPPPCGTVIGDMEEVRDYEEKKSFSPVVTTLG
jgi:hypothetical protein